MEYSFAARMARFSSSAVRDILKWTQGRDVISFAGGLPAEEYFPKEALRSAFDHVFREGTGKELQYGVTEGFGPLRERLADRMSRRAGLACSVSEVLLTSGSQQALDLAARIFLDEGDLVLTENPTYLAALQVFRSAGAHVMGVPGDDAGIDPAELERLLRERRPKLLYAIPTFANPTGRVWSLERRQAVLDLCRRYGTVILEDDPYGELRYEAAELPSLLALSGGPTGSPVLYTSTFSKTVVPALRTGWVVADERVIAQLAKAKQAADLHSSVLDQMALHRLLDAFDLDGHIERLRVVYRERLDTMAEALAQSAWRGVRFSRPQGGMFLWLELPEGLEAARLLPLALEEGVAFVPGEDFFADRQSPEAPRCLRLNFSHSSPARIREGMTRLQGAYERCQQRVL